MTDILTDRDADELFELLSVSQQQAVARGDVDLMDLLERVTRSAEAELCPRCASRTVSAQYGRLGLCAVCARKAMTEAFEERISELEARRDADRLKKQIQRLRDELEPDRSRRGGPSVKGKGA